MARKILLADDDAAVRDGISRLLRFEGYETLLAGDGRVALDLLGAPDSEPDLVLMDVEMPGLDGLAATRRIRASGSTVPILMITGRNAVGDRIVALDNGADGYLAKPFAAEELLARVRALLRRSPRREAKTAGAGAEPGGDRVLGYADVSMDLRTRTVHRGDRALDLTKTEYALLEFLLRCPGRVLSRERILRDVWGFEFAPASNTLDVYIMYLRRKLESRGEPRLIHTVRGMGYTLRTAPVS
ncbi:response regulator transcription factor [Streptomyces sp. GbtcB6]|uniref:response regulator transcription factor n=1 Tax=Streptomyces sp. GbtcB6 TaxID=2824751 RepID=UPI001C2FF1EB|nr:response regulator transcription factor [Streptomyces sp. GbtcB6]